MKKTVKKKRMAEGLMQGLQEAVLISQGKISPGRVTFCLSFRPAPKWSKTAIKKLREQYKMSQPAFASMLNVKVTTLRAWEQGQRTPDSAAARLLEIFSLDKELMKKFAA